MILLSDAELLFSFYVCLLRKPSSADAPVPHQDPQSYGQTSSKPHTLVTSPRTHQELPASPKLTATQLLSSTELIQPSPKNLSRS